ncbi:hypothetical protein L905_20550 [Agrobacterium sp. TS43]|uniref:hypothetical protein n=1 Tax=Agrobacterium TaxID=357 RepID=UPI00035C23A6|nr:MULTISPECIES: hypothetical protein [Agrobacterium]EPR22618.1 hypothetical protein L902_22145 [Agrobacterium radiobacter DSM 30147]KDR89610.1 hypothetical protein K538_04460 [Agrobacterium tumefaciens GW4]KVK44182.1 hypothetical protein L904_09740 [Agrobacterium sp. LY4]KVK44192.1 hypothetical protein L903_07875 [Agrobacterium sp. JL28]KVK58447.1 hypothetical protein L906_09710 [Agrobacterium sp. TS45]
MPIIAKIVSTTGAVRHVTLSDDPSDQEIIDALGGKVGDDYDMLGQANGYEVLRLKNGSTDKIVIGAPPQNSAPIKQRASCTISDTNAANLAKSFP